MSPGTCDTGVSFLSDVVTNPMVSPMHMVHGALVFWVVNLRPAVEEWRGGTRLVVSDVFEETPQLIISRSTFDAMVYSDSVDDS